MKSSKQKTGASPQAEGDYEVGYGRPPKHSQFKKGYPSPNPAGRAPGSKGLKTIYYEAFDQQKVTLNFAGKKKKASKKEAGMHMLAQKASTGDLKAIAMMLQLDEKLGFTAEAQPGQEVAAHHLATLENLIKLHAMFKD